MNLDGPSEGSARSIAQRRRRSTACASVQLSVVVKKERNIGEIAHRACFCCGRVVIWVYIKCQLVQSMNGLFVMKL